MTFCGCGADVVERTVHFYVGHPLGNTNEGATRWLAPHFQVWRKLLEFKSSQFVKTVLNLTSHFTSKLATFLTFRLKDPAVFRPWIQGSFSSVIFMLCDSGCSGSRY